MTYGGICVLRRPTPKTRPKDELSDGMDDAMKRVVYSASLQRENGHK